MSLIVISTLEPEDNPTPMEYFSTSGATQINTINELIVQCHTFLLDVKYNRNRWKDILTDEVNLSCDTEISTVLMSVFMDWLRWSNMELNDTLNPWVRPSLNDALCFRYLEL